MPGGVAAVASHPSGLLRSFILSEAIKRREASAGERAVVVSDSGLDFVRWWWWGVWFGAWKCEHALFWCEMVNGRRGAVGMVVSHVGRWKNLCRINPRKECRHAGGDKLRKRRFAACERMYMKQQDYIQWIIYIQLPKPLIVFFYLKQKKR